MFEKMGIMGTIRNTPPCACRKAQQEGFAWVMPNTQYLGKAQYKFPIPHSHPNLIVCSRKYSAKASLGAMVTFVSQELCC
ncbi:MAG: hypothetical protein HC903_27230 [Methylacidiphilales bacterium]|nr:hypothetical protein [Candidatus Methylacidiphilales bacterium]NJR17664.1 hypothetical protein [Calothrix sp. CSU_2_0]